MPCDEEADKSEKNICENGHWQYCLSWGPLQSWFLLWCSTWMQIGSFQNFFVQRIWALVYL